MMRLVSPTVRFKKKETLILNRNHHFIKHHFMKASILAKLDTLNERYEEVGALLSDSETIADQDRLRSLSKEYAELEPVVKAYENYRAVIGNLEESRLLMKDADADIRAMAEEEVESAEVELEDLQLALQKLLLPKDPNDEKMYF